MTHLIVRGCDLFRMTDGRPSVDVGQDIWIENQHIQAVVPSGSLSLPAGAQMVEASGQLAIPGLMNAHAHVPMVLFRGMVEDVSIDSRVNDYIFPMESNLTPEDVYWGAMLGLAEMIEAGITSVADHYFYMDQVVEAVRDSGMRANLAWAVFGHEGVEKLEQTAAFVRRWQGGAEGRITTWLGPHAPYTTGPAFLSLCAQKAKELSTGIHIHVSETAEQVRLSLRDYGISPVRMLKEAGVLDVPVILAHCLFPQEEDFAILADVRAGIAHAPKTYLKLGMGTAPVRRFMSAHIPVGLATDGAVSSNTLDILEQMRLLSLTQKGASHDSTIMTTAETLSVAFEGSARVLRMEEALGSLQVGKLADIALLRQDGLSAFPRFNLAANLVYALQSANVNTVICNGKILMQDRCLLTIDKKRIKAEIIRRLERLTRRVPGRRIAFYPS